MVQRTGIKINRFICPVKSNIHRPFHRWLAERTPSHSLTQCQANGRGIIKDICTPLQQRSYANWPPKGRRYSDRIHGRIMKRRFPLRSLQKPTRDLIRAHVRSLKIHECWRSPKNLEMTPLQRDKRMLKIVSQNPPNRKSLGSLRHQNAKGRLPLLENLVASCLWTHLSTNFSCRYRTILPSDG